MRRMNRAKCFFKGDRGRRVDDFGTQGVVKFKSLEKTEKFFYVSFTENCLMLIICMAR